MNVNSRATATEPGVCRLCYESLLDKPPSPETILAIVHSEEHKNEQDFEWVATVPCGHVFHRVCFNSHRLRSEASESNDFNLHVGYRQLDDGLICPVCSESVVGGVIRLYPSVVSQFDASQSSSSRSETLISESNERFTRLRTLSGRLRAMTNLLTSLTERKATVDEKINEQLTQLDEARSLKFQSNDRLRRLESDSLNLYEESTVLSRRLVESSSRHEQISAAASVGSLILSAMRSRHEEDVQLSAFRDSLVVTLQDLLGRLPQDESTLLMHQLVSNVKALVKSRAHSVAMLNSELSSIKSRVEEVTVLKELRFNNTVVQSRRDEFKRTSDVAQHTVRDLGNGQVPKVKHSASLGKSQFSGKLQRLNLPALDDIDDSIVISSSSSGTKYAGLFK